MLSYTVFICCIDRHVFVYVCLCSFLAFIQQISFAVAGLGVSSESGEEEEEEKNRTEKKNKKAKKQINLSINTILFVLPTPKRDEEGKRIQMKKKEPMFKIDIILYINKVSAWNVFFRCLWAKFNGFINYYMKGEKSLQNGTGTGVADNTLYVFFFWKHLNHYLWQVKKKTCTHAQRIMTTLFPFFLSLS